MLRKSPSTKIALLLAFTILLNSPLFGNSVDSLAMPADTILKGEDLANILKIGKLPAPAIIVEESVVGPVLGESSMEFSILLWIGCCLTVLVPLAVFYYFRIVRK